MRERSCDPIHAFVLYVPVDETPNVTRQQDSVHVARAKCMNSPDVRGRHPHVYLKSSGVVHPVELGKSLVVRGGIAVRRSAIVARERNVALFVRAGSKTG